MTYTVFGWGSVQLQGCQACVECAKDSKSFGSQRRNWSGLHPTIASLLLVSMSSVCGLSSSDYILAACLYVICVCARRCESGMESLRIGHLSHWWFRPVHKEFPVAN